MKLKDVIVNLDYGTQEVFTGVINITPVINNQFVEVLYDGGNKSTLFNINEIGSIEVVVGQDVSVANVEQTSEPQS